MDWLADLSGDSGLLDAQLFSLAGTPITLATLTVLIAIIVLTLLASRSRSSTYTSTIPWCKRLRV